MNLAVLATVLKTSLSGRVADLTAEAFRIGFPKLRGSGLLDFVVQQVEAQFPALTEEDKGKINTLVHALADVITHFAGV